MDNGQIEVPLVDVKESGLSCLACQQEKARRECPYDLPQAMPVPTTKNLGFYNRLIKF